MPTSISGSQLSLRLLDGHVFAIFKLVQFPVTVWTLNKIVKNYVVSESEDKKRCDSKLCKHLIVWKSHPRQANTKK